MENNLSYTDLIYLMIDGEASETERASLFSALKDSPELQLEFQNAIMINNSAKDYSNSTEVPAALTNSLFEKTGLSYINTSAATSSTATVSKFTSLLTSKKYTGYIISGIAGIIIGALFTFNTFDGNIEEGNLASNEGNNFKSNTENVFVINEPNDHITQTFPISSGFLAKNETSYYTERSEEKNNDKLAFSNEAQSSDQFGSSITDISQSNFILEESNIDLTTSKEHQFLNTNNMELKFLRSVKRKSAPDISLELNSSSYWNFPKATVSPESLHKFHNMNLFLYYNLSDNISLGMGVRQETFFVKYHTEDILSREYIYEQQPNLSNYEFAFRYVPFQYNYYKSLLQFNVGGSEYGYTYRFALGNQITISENISFILSLDFANLMYKHKDVWNNSKKLGINYGINYKF